jgi:hypothetical protein
VALWWALSSAAKIRPDHPAPAVKSRAVQLRAARNEREAAQVVLRSQAALNQFHIEPGALVGPGQKVIAVTNLEVLQVRYVPVAAPTDKSTQAGPWPDPLVPVEAPLQLAPGMNHCLWLRTYVPRDATAGLYRGTVRLRAEGWQQDVPVELAVYGFELPDKMTCQTAFGFSPEEVFRYHRLETEEQKRTVLDLYWASLSAHHISPYDPAPLDPISVTWPKVQPPKSQWDQWQNLRLVKNEVHSGQGALLAYDDKTDRNVVITYAPVIAIPPKGFRVRGWYRTAVPGHRFGVSLNHYDADQNWMSGRNRDQVLAGNGQWQNLDQVITEFPPGARFVRLNLMATTWTDAGENVGLVWYDDISIQDAESGTELVQGGDFEKRPRTELSLPADQLRPTFNFDRWDKAMARAFDVFHFNSFTVPIPGLGGGTFHELVQPNLLGFDEESPEYPLLLGSYCRQMESHLKAKGWLGPAYIYWFDEPSEDQYPYLQKGFGKLKRYCPEITRMITKHVEPGLIGGPNLWCAISDQHHPAQADERRQFGERFWWYVCTGPKAPYAGLFLDHAAPELRVWLWQTFQRQIHGILVWQCNYWNSGTAYPDASKPQNPYEDPMSWTTGYGTPSGTKLPWGNGDGRFIYPPVAAASGRPAGPVLQGPVDSIRWEHLRDGIEDYEYLTILSRTLAERRARLAPGRAGELEQLLTVPESITRSMTEFARDGAPIEQRRHQVARAIEELKL